MDNKTYEISSAEWEVMNIIWMKKYASANNIIEEIQMQKDWSPKTIRTLITRLYKNLVNIVLPHYLCAEILK